jgi:hypothetical protein
MTTSPSDRIFPLAFIVLLLFGSTIFAREAIRGVRRGITRFPMQIIGIEEFERGHTMFWGVIGANVLAAFMLVGVAITLLIKTWP